ncbi:MAG: Uma2 family endonuclease [Chloroflexota bacterium]|nr:Uma2 family endonuclease [Chloroflexota bacterium]
MNDLITTNETEATYEIGSHNHSAIQANLAFLLKRLNKYSVYTELSLDVSQLDSQRFKIREEIKPDVCIYPKRGLSRPFDILKMAEMPLLVVEILSPRQGTQEILEKFAVYFALGVQSCWLIDPTIVVVAVYSALEQHKVFAADEIVDQVVDVRLPFTEIFE